MLHGARLQWAAQGNEKQWIPSMLMLLWASGSNDERRDAGKEGWRKRGKESNQKGGSDCHWGREETEGAEIRGRQEKEKKRIIKEKNFKIHFIGGCAPERVSECWDWNNVADRVQLQDSNPGQPIATLLIFRLISRANMNLSRLCLTQQNDGVCILLGVRDQQKPVIREHMQWRYLGKKKPVERGGQRAAGQG